MSHNQKRKALQRAAESEARARAAKSTPGSVVVTFNKPAHPVPWWRSARDSDFQVIYTNSNAGSQGDVVIIETTTEAGQTIRRFLNWRDVDTVVAVPHFPAPAADPKE